MSMLWRNWVAFVAILAIVLSVLGVLSHLQYNAILARLIQERLAVIAETSAAPFRSVIGLGLPISTVRNAREILGRAKEIDPAVSDIRVFHQTGIVVHATSDDKGPAIARDILLLQSLSPGDRWDAETDSDLLAGLTLRNSTGDPIGGILVSAANLDFQSKSQAMAEHIALVAGVIFIAFSALALLVLRLRLSGAIRGLGQLDRLSEAFSDDRHGQSNAGETVPATANYGFMSGEIVRLEAQLNAAFQRFRLARQELSCLSGQALPSDPVSDEVAPRVRTVTASVPETSLARVFARNLTPWAAAIILGSALTLGLFVQDEVTRSFEPELAARTMVIGTVANENVQRAVSAGVPLTDLVGAEHYFSDLLQHFPEVSYFGIATGRIIFESGTRQKTLFGPERSRKDVPTFPITDDGEQIGYIIIDTNAEFFALQFRDMLLDFGVVVLVVMLLAFQIMTVVMSRSMTAPFMRLQHLAALQAASDFSKVITARGASAIDRLSRKLSDHATQLHRAFHKAASQLRADREVARLERLEGQFKLRRWLPDRLQFSYLNDVRLPLFLFAAADELPLAFFPLFTKAADNPLTWLDPLVVISLPIAGYLIAIVLGSPLARPLSERLGHRKLLLLAVAPTVLAHIGLYLSTSVIEIVLFRTIAGFGYAIATLTCQDYVLDAVPRQDRSRSLGLFTAAMFSGIFAGTALGGVLADRLGQNSVFAISAGLVLISGFLTFRLLPARAARDSAGPPAPGATLPPIWRPLGSLRFAALVFGIAIPANILLQAFISFLVALELNRLGASAADTGRILMTYFIAIVFVGPLAPHLFHRRLSPFHVGFIGALLSAISLTVVVAWPAAWSMLIAVAGAGVAHGMVRDPQVTAAMDIAERELAHLGPTAVLGSLRTLERLGSIVGLVSIALLASYAGYVTAIAAIAALVFVGAVAFAVTLFTHALSSRSRQTAGLPQADRD